MFNPVASTIPKKEDVQTSEVESIFTLKSVVTVSRDRCAPSVSSCIALDAP
jgi:hypothetical protein